MNRSINQILDSEISSDKKEINSIYLGIFLLVFFIFIFFVLPIFSKEEIISIISKMVYGFIRIGFMFKGQTYIKKLNRNYTYWSIFLYLFTSPALIIIGTLTKIKKEITLINFNPSLAETNINNLPDIVVGTDSYMPTEAATNSTFTLKHMLKNYSTYTKEYSLLFPIIAAYTINERGEPFGEDVLTALNNFAKENKYESFGEMIEHLKTLNPEQINKLFV